MWTEGEGGLKKPGSKADVFYGRPLISKKNLMYTPVYTQGGGLFGKCKTPLLGNCFFPKFSKMTPPPLQFSDIDQQFSDTAVKMTPPPPVFWHRPTVSWHRAVKMTPPPAQFSDIDRQFPDTAVSEIFYFYNTRWGNLQHFLKNFRKKIQRA